MTARKLPAPTRRELAARCRQMFARLNGDLPPLPPDAPFEEGEVVSVLHQGKSKTEERLGAFLRYTDDTRQLCVVAFRRDRNTMDLRIVSPSLLARANGQLPLALGGAK